VIEIRNLVKVYNPKNGVPVRAVDGVNLKIADTGMVFLLGKSGSGKSTMLNLLGGLDQYDSGEIIIKGKSSKDFSQSEFDSLRNTYVGFIFQEYNILSEFNVGQNIALAMELQGKKATPQALDELLDTVDLTGYARRKPNELSGGQKQRVAIARALIKNPEIIMADEPTGALDSVTGRQVLMTLKKLSKSKLVIVVSHDREFAEKYGDRIIEMADGKIISDTVKHLSQSEKLSEGVEVIDDKVLRIRDGESLTDEEFDKIRTYIKNSGQNVYISLDNEISKTFAEAARIDEQGGREGFKSTEAEDIRVKTYGEGDFKLIKSRLPMKNAFAIGASGLKSKPVRLMFTVFLAAVAFTMFGLSDTFGTYNKYKTTVQSIIDTGIDYATFSRQEKQVYGDGANDYWYDDKMMQPEDAKFLQERYGELGLIPVYNQNQYGSIDIDRDNFISPAIFEKSSAAFFSTSVSGYAAADQAYFDRMGYELTGSLPKDKTQVVITAYTAELYVRAGWVNPDNENDRADKLSAADMIGKKVRLGGKTLTVCGIVDTHADIEGKYDAWKVTDESANNNQGDLLDYLTYEAMDNYIMKGAHAIAFVDQSFIDRNFTFFKASEIYTNDGYGAFVKGSVSGIEYDYEKELYANYVFDVKDMPADGTAMTMDGRDITDIGKDEVLIPLDMVYNLQILGKDKPSGKEVDVDQYNDANIKLVRAQVTGKTALYRHWADMQTAKELKSMTTEDKTYRMMESMLYDAGDWDVEGYSAFISKLYQNTMMQLTKDLKRAGVTLPELTYVYQSYYDELGMEGGESYQVKLKVAGFYANTNSERASSILMTGEGLSQLTVGKAEYAPIKFVTGAMPTDEAAVVELVNFHFDGADDTYRFPLQNTVTVLLEEVNSIIESLAVVFLYIGIGFAVFASFMLLNYISTSISYKKREIGVLRAVGARSSDVFRIFFSEAFLIAVINWLMATGICAGAVSVINSVLRSDYGLELTLLNFGIRQVALLIFISLAVAFVSSFFPVMKIAKKKPIDAINGR